MPKRYSPRTQKILDALDGFEGMLLVFGVIALAIVVAAAFEAYAGKSPIRGTEALGQVGDYFGGVLNPILGFATLIMITYTLGVAKRQLAAFMDEGKRADLQRRIEAAYLDWERLNDQDFHGRVLHFQEGRLWSISFRSFWRDADARDEVNTFWEKRSRSENYPIDHMRDFRPASDLVEEIAEYLIAYDMHVGNRDLTDFYRRRLSAAATICFRIGWLSPTARDSLMPSKPRR